jgi:hypothetical protein
MEIRYLENNELLERKVVIYRHSFVNLKLDKAALKRAFFFDDKNFPDKITLEEFKKYRDLFMEKVEPVLKEKNIFVFDFNFMNSLILHGIKTRMEKLGMAFWLFVSFFNDDSENIKNGKNAEAIIDKKVKLLEDMMTFPYIQKIEIAADGVITEQYLLELFEDYFMKNFEIVGMD